MNALAMLMSFASAILAIQIQQVTTTIIDEQNHLRLWIMSSRERCPKAPPQGRCSWHIEARNHGEWAICDHTHPPSGADLPMHRWFRLQGHCPLEIYGINLNMPTVPMKIFR